MTERLKVVLIILQTIAILAAGGWVLVNERQGVAVRQSFYGHEIEELKKELLKHEANCNNVMQEFREEIRELRRLIFKLEQLSDKQNPEKTEDYTFSSLLDSGERHNWRRRMHPVILLGVSCWVDGVADATSDEFEVF